MWKSPEVCVARILKLILAVADKRGGFIAKASAKESPSLAPVCSGVRQRSDLWVQPIHEELLISFSAAVVGDKRAVKTVV
jgi:hypothetical protein